MKDSSTLIYEARRAGLQVSWAGLDHVIRNTERRRAVKVSESGRVTTVAPEKRISVAKAYLYLGIVTVTPEAGK